MSARAAATTAAAASSVDGAIDEALYSRQLYVMGHEAQARMASASVLVVGLSGTGVEVAKNLALAGLKGVKLYDPTPLAWQHMASNFYATQEADLGKRLDEVVAPHLAELNPYCRIGLERASGWHELLTPQRLEQYRAVVLVNELSLERQVELDEACRAAGAALVAVQSRGVFGAVVTDFGDSHTVLDATGEEPSSTHVSFISNEEHACVTCLEDHRHQFEEGDYVVFCEVEGMSAINEGDKPHRVLRVNGPYSFVIETDTRPMGDYVRGGIVTEVKVPRTLHFAPLRQLLLAPAASIDAELLMWSDYAKLERPPVLHELFRALSQYGRLPRPGAESEVPRLAALLPADVADEHASLVEAFVRTAAGDISPMASFLGGVAAQEVLKAVSSRFTPIRQLFYFDATESLPHPLPDEAEAAPRHCRYDGQIAVYGAPLQQQLHQLNYFCVGAGAIGAELLKCWACMGVGLASHRGRIAITDMDHIERSNLNRQFLFRAADVGKNKAVAARAATLAVNPALDVVAYETRVGPETERVFDDAFWEPLDGVCNALDNVEARLYVDQRCVYYLKPLLDSGTLGTKGSTQVVVPHLTASYGSTRDPPEKSIPVCTLKNFPYRIEHTLQWARDLFEGLFKTAADDANNYIQRGDEFISELEKQGGGAMLAALENVHDCLVSHRPRDFADCVQWARLQFERLYHHSIRQLLHAFPRDMLDRDGQPFWSGTKRAPTPLVFDATDALHVEFVLAAARLRAENFGLSPDTHDVEWVRQVASAAAVPAFVPRQGVKIAATEEEATAAAAANGAAIAGSADDDQQRIEALLRALPSPAELATTRLQPLEFEKDDDERYDMAFVTAASNLRASNYAIPPADMHKSRGIAGRIIPAIATTTALVAGLVNVELIKLAQLRRLLRNGPARVLASSTLARDSLTDEGERRLAAGVDRAQLLSRFKDGFVNLALPLFAFSEPAAAPLQPMTAGGERTFSLWDRLEVDAHGTDLTLGEFLALFERQYGLTLTMLSCGVAILYSGWLAPKKAAERRAMRMVEVARSVGKLEVRDTDKYLVFEVMAEDAQSGEEVEVPYVRYQFRE
ncbi:hypothetical protein CDCA_CDCA02G0476 [Cyanidium caldarium]|uniref:E1 ubiquitin-activating enzyme n=1 Tax=Cyanidium caldarium TaxID=2771 RepID=A0AAV9IQV3_CYACA|nr:hypothetical protein CDCA_CDCA02G0476 [Cyanidium caldarium]